MSQISRSEQATLWKQHLISFLEADRVPASESSRRLLATLPLGLTSETRAVIEDAIADEVDWIHEEGIDISEKRDRIASFNARVAKRIDSGTMLALFGQVGPRDRFVDTASSMRVNCTCKQSLLYCGGGEDKVCVASFPICEDDGTGCGILVCDGKCINIT